MTSEWSVEPNSSGVEPEAACNDRSASCTGERPSVAMSPQPAATTARAVRTSVFQDFNIALTIGLLRDDSRRDEDEQLAALVGHLVASEQEADKRQIAESGRPRLRRLFGAEEDAA